MLSVQALIWCIVVPIRVLFAYNLHIITVDYGVIPVRVDC